MREGIKQFMEDLSLFMKQNPKVATTKSRSIMLLSKCAVSDSKKWNFIKEQEVIG